MISYEQWTEAEKTAGKTGERASVSQVERLSAGAADIAYWCKGHSMEPTVYDGDLILIHRQDTFSDGQIAAVRIGDGITLKRVYKLTDGYRLIPDNTAFQPLEITGKDAETVSIIGIAVARAAAEE